MKIGKNGIYLAQLFCAGLWGILLFPALGWAGNKAHIESRVENLDNLNKKVVTGFSDIPKAGTITYKAIVTESNEGAQVKIIEKQIKIKISPVPQPPVKRPKTSKKTGNLIKTQTKKQRWNDAD